jgi:CheY-like chemotaxis protein
MSMNMRKMRVLVVDDDPSYRELGATLLRQNGFVVEESSGARDAVWRLALGGIDAVLTDLIMPDMDGIELCLAIAHYAPKLKIVAMTGDLSLMHCSERLLKHLGVSAVLAKPLDPDQVLAALESTAAQAS